jgi:hypothetical protein
MELLACRPGLRRRSRMLRRRPAAARASAQWEGPPGQAGARSPRTRPRGRAPTTASAARAAQHDHVARAEHSGDRFSLSRLSLERQPPSAPHPPARRGESLRPTRPHLSLTRISCSYAGPKRRCRSHRHDSGCPPSAPPDHERTSASARSPPARLALLPHGSLAGLDRAMLHDRDRGRGRVRPRGSWAGSHAPGGGRRGARVNERPGAQENRRLARAGVTPMETRGKKGQPGAGRADEVAS